MAVIKPLRGFFFAHDGHVRKSSTACATDISDRVRRGPRLQTNGCGTQLSQRCRRMTLNFSLSHESLAAMNSFRVVARIAHVEHIRARLRGTGLSMDRIAILQPFASPEAKGCVPGF
jgi:hypothetical protein